MWILSIGTLSAILFGIYPLQNFHNPAHQVAHALFFALQRNSWGIAIAWIVFSCEMGYGGVVRKFLEMPIWVPLGRMSLSFYLVHGLYFSVHVGTKRYPINFNDFELVIRFTSIYSYNLSLNNYPSSSHVFRCTLMLETSLLQQF